MLQSSLAKYIQIGFETMPKEVQIKVISNFVKKYKSGFPLITSDALINGQVLKEEGTIIKLTDEKGNFIGKGYYGKQNKGLGWILTNNKDQPFNQAFFVTKITNALNHRKQLFADPNTTAFRIFNGEGDGVGGITIDYFDGFYLINWYSIGIYQFRNVILDALKEVVDYKGIY